MNRHQRIVRVYLMLCMADIGYLGISKGITERSTEETKGIMV